VPGFRSLPFGDTYSAELKDADDWALALAAKILDCDPARASKNAAPKSARRPIILNLIESKKNCSQTLRGFEHRGQRSRSR